jgi:hypothetical protein
VLLKKGDDNKCCVLGDLKGGNPAIFQSTAEKIDEYLHQKALASMAKYKPGLYSTPGAYPASCTMGTGSFSGVKRPGHVVDLPPPSSTEVKERVELYLYSLSGPSWHVPG